MFRNHVFTVLMCSLLWTFSALSATPIIDNRDNKSSFIVAQGLEHWLNGRAKPAFDAFSKAAVLGNKVGLFYLGEMSQHGIYLPKENQTAERYYQLAANLGYDTAWRELGRLHVFFSDDPLRQRQGLTELNTVKQPDAQTHFLLAEAYHQGRGTVQDLAVAFRYFKLAADAGHLDSLFTVGRWLYTGRGTAKNIKLAVEYYHQAAAKGQVRALHNLGAMYIDGDDVNQDYVKGKGLIAAAARQGFEPAQVALEQLTQQEYVRGEQQQREAQWGRNALIFGRLLSGIADFIDYRAYELRFSSFPPDFSRQYYNNKSRCVAPEMELTFAIQMNMRLDTVAKLEYPLSNEGDGRYFVNVEPQGKRGNLMGYFEKEHCELEQFVDYRLKGLLPEGEQLLFSKTSPCAYNPHSLPQSECSSFAIAHKAYSLTSHQVEFQGKTQDGTLLTFYTGPNAAVLETLNDGSTYSRYFNSADGYKWFGLREFKDPDQARLMGQPVPWK